MAEKPLKILTQPNLNDARMVLGFSGWMDGGEVSTGTIEYLVARLKAREIGRIDPAGFYIYGIPGPMEALAQLRPHTRIEDGLITEFQAPTNTFFCSEEHNLVLLAGSEPNLRWPRFADCIFETASRCNVSTIYFIGSVAGLAPHSREPRVFSSVSEASLKPALEQYGLRFSNYEGPASISTYMTQRSTSEGKKMATLVAEVPAYVQAKNYRCIEAVTKRLAAILDLQITLDDLRAKGDRLERRLNEIIKSRPELAERIGQLEADYDHEVFDSQMGDLKDWLEQQGIRLD